ncbi:MAG TPA: RNA helicase, partial [Anaerolineae bacterium]|nr:RNA helicase [Anaerolineae bacterium]
MPNQHPSLGRQLPLRHLSIRVPWNDTDWTGRICHKPGANMSCTVLGNIRDNRDEKAERELAGKSWEGLGEAMLPPCVRERGGFMAPYPLSVTVRHPYTASSPAHGHLLPTTVRFPAYSAPALPFSWYLLEMAQEKARSLALNFRSDIEEQIEKDMGFKSNWVQTGHNQMVMLETFYSAIQPDRSLCIFYAKKTPLTEDPRRVIIGAGFVRGLGDVVPYARSGEGSDPIIWERPILHSIRDGFADGFLLPYHQLLDYANAHPEENPEQFVAFAPAEHFEAFSYASEHVNSDGAIAALLSCAAALTRIDRVLPGDRSHIQAWIDARLAELWRMRGPCPGLGAALTAFGLERGTLLAYELERVVAADHPDGMVDPWPYVDRLFAADPALPESLRQVSPTLRRVWEGLPAERKALVQLLARFDLSPEQATRYFVHEDSSRARLGIAVADADILSNPYLLYELDRIAPDAIPLAVIDRGLFPDATIATAFPLPEPSQVADATDPRRVRAYVVEALELAAALGDTLLPRDRLVTQLRERELRPGLPLTGDIMAVCAPDLLPVAQAVQLAD